MAMFAFRSCSFVSAASSFIAFSALPGVSLTFAWRLDTSIACLGLKDRVITMFKETKILVINYLLIFIHLLKNEIQDTWASASCRILS
jgi:hypothetical protein